jgi:hypothetical protein
MNYIEMKQGYIWNQNEMTYINPLGIMLFEGVIVLFDEDFDDRILTFLHDIGSPIRSSLMAAHEHKGTLQLFWKTAKIPPFLSDGMCVDVCGDTWCINYSEMVSKKLERHLYL